MSICEVCHGTEGFIDLKTNTFRPCQCLVDKKHEYLFQKYNLPKKYWNLEFKNRYSDKNIVKIFLDSRIKLDKDHLVIQTQNTIKANDFIHFVFKDFILNDKAKAFKICFFSELLVGISTAWKNVEEIEKLGDALKQVEILAILNLDISMLKENMNTVFLENVFQHREQNKKTTIITSSYMKDDICNQFNIDSYYFSNAGFQ